jgi:hypothetical protein
MLSQTKEEKMAKLTDSQLIVLSKAAAREDGAAVVPPKLNKAAAVKIGSRLIGRKLMREIRSKPGTPVWRADEDGPSMSLVITRAGRDAIDIIKPDEMYQPVSNKSGAAKRANRHQAGAAPRPGSKQALVVGMLSNQHGTTLDALAGGKLRVPRNISLLHLPPYSPELNPAENIWQFLRQNHLSNRVFESYTDIVDACCAAWNAIVSEPKRITSIAKRDWASVSP